MIKSILRSLKFMSKLERSKFYLLILARSVAAIFDLIGILAIGLLATSIALFITQGSASDRRISFAGVDFPAITAQTLPFTTVIILLLFLLKAISSILLTKALATFLAKVEARAAKSVAKLAFGTNLKDAKRFSREEIYFAVQNGSPNAFNGLLNHFGTIISEGILFVFVIVAFLIVNPFIALAAVLYFGLVGLTLQILVGNLMQKSSMRIAVESVTANSSIGDLSEVFRESTIYGRNEFLIDYSEIENSKLDDMVDEIQKLI
jgi:ATP-binding cassette subfamily C protein